MILRALTAEPFSSAVNDRDPELAHALQRVHSLPYAVLLLLTYGRLSPLVHGACDTSALTLCWRTVGEHCRQPAMSHEMRPAVMVEDTAENTDSHSDSAPVERQSVSDLVCKYGEPHSEAQKRGRSESGDPAPPGKRGLRGDSSSVTGRSPSSAGSKMSVREIVDAAIEDLENRMRTSISRDLHEFRETLSTQIERLSDRVIDLERHVEERDGAIADLTDELRQSRSEVAALQARVEDAEMNSRLPCLILSGPAMAPATRPVWSRPCAAARRRRPTGHSP